MGPQHVPCPTYFGASCELEEGRLTDAVLVDEKSSGAVWSSDHEAIQNLLGIDGLLEHLRQVVFP